MLRPIIKLLLVGTALAPALLIMVIEFYATKGMPTWAYFGNQLVIIACCLVAVAMKSYAANHRQHQTLRVIKAKNSDKEVLTFLLAYLLPVLNDHKYRFKEMNLPTLAILALVCAVVYHSNAFDFNPLLGIRG